MDTQSRTSRIDAATFDLKAVNPRARVERDTRTPAQILDAIAGHGRAVEAALNRLQAPDAAAGMQWTLPL